MSTNIKNSVTTVLQIISDLRGETTTNTDAVRIRAVSRANKDFALRKLWSFYLLKDQSVSGDGSNDYSVGSATYPMRPKGLTELFVSDGGTTTESERFSIVEFQVYKNLYNRDSTEQMTYLWYDDTNDAWKVHVNPAPTASDTVYYSYYWQPPTLTASSDNCVCPNPRIIALLAAADIHDSEDERDIAKDEKNEAEMLISELEGLDNMPMRNQLYAMGNIESVIKDKGIGNY